MPLFTGEFQLSGCKQLCKMLWAMWAWLEGSWARLRTAGEKRRGGCSHRAKDEHGVMLPYSFTCPQHSLREVIMRGLYLEAFFMFLSDKTTLWSFLWGSSGPQGGCSKKKKNSTFLRFYTSVKKLREGQLISKEFRARWQSFLFRAFGFWGAEDDTQKWKGRGEEKIKYLFITDIHEKTLQVLCREHACKQRWAVPHLVGLWSWPCVSFMLFHYHSLQFPPALQLSHHKK